MKKVLFVIESLGGGGAEKVLTTIVKNLDRTKFEVTVLTVVETGVYVDEVKKYCRLKTMLPDYNALKSPIEKMKYKIKYKFIYSAKPESVYKKYVREQYDVEIAFVEGYVTKFVMGSPNVNSKKICWVHIDMEKNAYADQYFNSIEEEKRIYSQYDEIVGVSNSVKEVFERKFALTNTISVIYNPIDMKEILEKSCEKIPFKRNKDLQIVTSGRLEPQKGYDRLITALGKISKENKSFHVWILGEGSMHAKLENLIHINHLENMVTLLGFQRNPYPWIAGSDAFVCTSRAEGFSLVIAEAMVLKTPVFSVDCSGPNELLDYGKYGILVENTEEQLTDMLRKLILKKIDLEDLKKKSEQRSKEFNINKVMKQIEEIIA